MESQHDTDIPDHILEKSVEARGKLIPKKSSERYAKEFELFCKWRNENGVQKTTEDVMLAYLLDLSKKFNSSSLWSKYSMVKSSLLVNENVDISRFPKLIAFLKKMSVGYQPNQSKTLSRDEVNRFLKEADNTEYLLAKVVCMLGVAGGCRREELHEMSLDDVDDTGAQLVVTLPDTKTNKKRVFTVINEVEGINFLELFRLYIGLRPKTMTGKKLFVGYRNGKCIAQRVGIHTIGAMPKKIASFLKLETPEKYTGHCFRRTSATLLANAGVDLTVLKRHGGWKSSTVAEKYIEDSIEGKKKVARMIQGGENFIEVLQQESSTISTTSSVSAGNNPGFNMSGNTGCTFHININNNDRG